MKKVLVYSLGIMMTVAMATPTTYANTLPNKHKTEVRGDKDGGKKDKDKKECCKDKSNCKHSKTGKKKSCCSDKKS
jgi:uncharacterized protein YxeA